MKKLVSLLLAIMMVAAMAGGFSALAEDKPVIQVIVPDNVQDFPDGMDEDHNFIVDYWREKTGYDFDVFILSEEEPNAQLATMLNAGECTGLIVTRDAANIGRFAMEEVIMSLEDYKDKATIYTMNDCSSGTYNGEQYGFCQSDSINYGNYRGLWYVNTDILAELGMELPATLDEFNAYLYAAKDAGYLPLGVYGDPATSGTFSMLKGLYGLGGGDYIADAEGNISYKYVTEEGKAYLEYIKKLYDDGIIPADFASQTEEGISELLLSGKAACGTGIACWTTAVMNSAEEMGIPLRFADYPTDINGNPSWGSDFFIGYGATSLVFMIAEGCEYVDECIELLNLWCTDECINLHNNGLEGVHWEYVDGKVTPIEGAEDLRWGVFYRNVYKMDYWYETYGINANWNEYYYPCERNNVGCPNYDPILHMPVDAERVLKLDELRDSIVKPFYTKVVMGEESIENWDAMVEQWKSEGGEELMAWYSEQYKALGCPTSYYWTQLPDEHPEYTGKFLYGGAEAAATQLTVSTNK